MIYRCVRELGNRFGQLKVCILFITKTSRYNDDQQSLSYCQHGCYSHIYTTSVHTSLFRVSNLNWSLTFKIIPRIPQRIDLILLVLISRVTPNNYKIVGIYIWSTPHQSYVCTDIYVVHLKNYENKYTTIQCTKFFCPRFGLSTFWFVDVFVCRCFGPSTFWFVDALACWRFGLSTFRCVDVSVCWRFDQLPTKGSTLTHQSLVENMVIILQTTYPNGFLQWHFYNLALHEF